MVANIQIQQRIEIMVVREITMLQRASTRNKMVQESECPKIWGHIAVRQDHCIVVIGGNTVTRPWYHIIWTWNLYTERWTKHKIPRRRLAPDQDLLNEASGVTIGECIYILETYNYYLNDDNRNDVWQLTQNSHGCFSWDKIMVTPGNRKPSPRMSYSCWEYTGDMWIFGGYGRPLDGYLNDHGDFVSVAGIGFNNQLLQFNPVRKEWTNAKVVGDVPSPRANHASTIIGHKVFLFGGQTTPQTSAEVYKLDMLSLTWTHIQTGRTKPAGRSFFSLNEIADNRLLLHGGQESARFAEHIFSDTWILDLTSQTWKKYTSERDYPRYCHTGTYGLNNDVFIIGGIKSHNGDPYELHEHISHVMLAPKTLQQLAMLTVHKHMSVLPWSTLPDKLIKLLKLMGVATEDNISWL